MLPIFDAHLDLAWNALSFDRDLNLEVEHLRRAEEGMIDEPSRGGCTVTFPELRAANVRVCVATILARSGQVPAIRATIPRTDLDFATDEIAYATARGQLAYYRMLEAKGVIRIIETAEDLTHHWGGWADADSPLGVILSMEGADPLAPPMGPEAWWASGLRAVGLSHYGVSRYAHGTATDGPLSPAGRVALQDFERLGMILDVTHLSDASMAEALDDFEGPVLASHHNCREIVPGDRQLTDDQIGRLVRRGAVIGCALDAWMIVPDWDRGVSTRDAVGLDDLARHIDHVCEIAGSAKHSAIGSDLDGGFGREQIPREMDTIADLQLLAEVLSGRGYADADIEAIFYGNWLRFFSEALPRS